MVCTEYILHSSFIHVFTCIVVHCFSMNVFVWAEYKCLKEIEYSNIQRIHTANSMTIEKVCVYCMLGAVCTIYSYIKYLQYASELKEIVMSLPLMAAMGHVLQQAHKQPQNNCACRHPPCLHPSICNTTFMPSLLCSSIAHTESQVHGSKVTRLPLLNPANNICSQQNLAAAVVEDNTDKAGEKLESYMRTCHRQGRNPNTKTLCYRDIVLFGVMFSTVIFRHHGAQLYNRLGLL